MKVGGALEDCDGWEEEDGGGAWKLMSFILSSNSKGFNDIGFTRYINMIFFEVVCQECTMGGNEVCCLVTML